MAEFQLAGFLSDLVHGEVHDPAELILFLIHMFGAEQTQFAAHDAGRLLCHAQGACSQANEIAGLQAQAFDHLIFDGLYEF